MLFPEALTQILMILSGNINSFTNQSLGKKEQRGYYYKKRHAL